MKAFEIKRLMVVALVACLPIACGSSSPTGPDVMAVDADATVSALRNDAGLPPTAPEAPSPESVPVPDKGDPTTDPLPEADGDVVPPPPADDTGSVPQPPPADTIPTSPVIVPPPSDVEVPRACPAAAAEILIRRGSLPQPLYRDSVLLEIVMLGKDGREVTCHRTAWSFDNLRYAADATITVSADTRFATIAGLAGAYTIRATTTNGISATVGITLP